MFHELCLSLFFQYIPLHTGTTVLQYLSDLRCSSQGYEVSVSGGRLAPVQFKLRECAGEAAAFYGIADVGLAHADAFKFRRYPVEAWVAIRLDRCSGQGEQGGIVVDDAGKLNASVHLFRVFGGRIVDCLPDLF